MSEHECIPCYHCRGTGKDPYCEDSSCDECDGSGYELMITMQEDDYPHYLTVSFEDILETRY